jgi:hypothetical protein
VVRWRSETHLTVPLLSARRSMICEFSKMWILLDLSNIYTFTSVEMIGISELVMVVIFAMREM